MSKKSKAKPKQLPATSKGLAATVPWSELKKDARLYHGRAVPGSVYRMASAQTLGQAMDQGPDPSAFAQAVIEDMAPRDPVEEMLIAQLLMAHSRVMRLTQLANAQPDLAALSIMHEYADRASNTYRRLMLALAEYRRPPRTGDTFAVVKQANIAQQQVIQTNEKTATNTTNEQGYTNSDDAADADSAGRSRPSALPADSGGVGVPAFLRPKSQAVDQVHRPANARGQGPRKAERGETR